MMRLFLPVAFVYAIFLSRLCLRRLPRVWPLVRHLCYALFGGLCWLLPLSQALPAGAVRQLLGKLGNLWLGILLFSVPSVLLAYLLHLVCHKKAGQLTALLCLLLTASLCLGSSLHARRVKTLQYTLAIPKAAALQQLDIVLLSDLHLGYNMGPAQLESLAAAISAEPPDLILLAGDILDNGYDSLSDPQAIAAAFRAMPSRYGCYACYGNHDAPDDPRFGTLLQSAGIHVLHDTGVCIADSVYLFGRADAKRPGLDGKARKSPAQLAASAPDGLPLLVLDHEPRELDALAQAGVDAVFGGHTHNGQIFPLRLALPLLFQNPYGLKQIDGMYSIVTSGVGANGPYMRLGTDSELCRIRLCFTHTAERIERGR